MDLNPLIDEVVVLCPKNVDDVLRQHVKQICYGIIYGMGPKTLSEQLGTTEEEAQNFISCFLIKYPRVKKFTDRVVALCRMHGYVETIGGRRRYFPQINSSNGSLQRQAERQAVNTTIQGSAADLAKMAMVAVEIATRKAFNDPSHVKLVLHIHDEFLYEVTHKYTNKAAKLIKTTMENAVQFTMPFPVTIKTGNSWGTLNVLEFEPSITNSKRL